jgi:hypothetical protein
MNTQQLSLFATSTPLVEDVAQALPTELRGILNVAGLDSERQYIALRRYSELARPTAAGFQKIVASLSVDQAGVITKQGGFNF